MFILVLCWVIERPGYIFQGRYQIKHYFSAELLVTQPYFSTTMKKLMWGYQQSCVYLAATYTYRPNLCICEFRLWNNYFTKKVPWFGIMVVVMVGWKVGIILNVCHQGGGDGSLKSEVSVGMPVSCVFAGNDQQPYESMHDRRWELPADRRGVVHSNGWGGGRWHRLGGCHAAMGQPMKWSVEKNGYLPDH
jgi:hypothetical protein